ncbi:DUF7844 domain-containing protein [Halopseudomonas xinjiangensis]|uniref:DUF7844 domain-containing protein n=1 Tax=Halopseudomonas xinjiangensis TaxID=487184 RepID=UPI001E4A26FF|nr:DUF4105 domain-containing protein [Halopseudomonas xinjiangensis]
MRSILVTLILCLCFSAKAAALQLLFDDPTLTPLERQITLDLLDQAHRSLPPTMVERLDRSVEVSWSRRLPPHVIGRATVAGQLWLNRQWLAPLVAAVGDSPFDERSHGGLRKELLSTVIHELGHMYDRAQTGPSEQRGTLRRCRWQFQSTGVVGLSAACRGSGQRRHSLSDDPRVLDLAGWSELTGGRGQRYLASDRPDRTPDAYELKSPAEFAAVNLEYFLLDPEYACRRPELYDYFADHFDWAPPRAACGQSYPYLRAGLRDDHPVVGSIDPSRLYAVHYLLAEPNREWASRWGHSMLRVVLCAPGRAPGPDCLLDLEHHLVLSFRAFVNDLQLSSWDGLTGEYPSRLFILPLGQVVDEYTRLELRGLQSIPLELSAEQRADLIRQAAQLHWSYDGRYYFVSNNCAVETLKLLRIGTRDSRLATLESITPTGLLQALDARGMADLEVINDRNAALRRGYYFDSQRQRYERMLMVVRDELPIQAEDLDGWLELPAASRRSVIQQAGRRASAALLVLEQAAHDRHMMLAQQEVKRLYLSQPQGDGAAAGHLVEQLLAQSAFLSRPASLSVSGYGLPQPEEWALMQDQARRRHSELKQLAESVEQMLPGLLSPDRQRELEGAKHNLELLAERIRTMHRASGGMQLH